MVHGNPGAVCGPPNPCGEPDVHPLVDNNMQGICGHIKPRRYLDVPDGA